jgi:hypothetical protein
MLRTVKDKGWFSSLGNGTIVHSRNATEALYDWETLLNCPVTAKK